MDTLSLFGLIAVSFTLVCYAMESGSHWWTLGFCLGCGGITPAQAQSGVPTAGAQAEYRLGSGDVIRINVYQNPDLTLETRVTEAGVVSYPLLAAGRTGSSLLPSPICER